QAGRIRRNRPPHGAGRGSHGAAAAAIAVEFPSGTRERERSAPVDSLVAVPNIFEPEFSEAREYRCARLGEQAGAEHLGASLYELGPGQGMVFHYHVQREELLIVLRGCVGLRTAEGWEDLSAGEVVAFPRGEHGAHGFANRGPEVVRVLVVSETNAPNSSVYPDTN